jgi:hypothetical protein
MDITEGGSSIPFWMEYPQVRKDYKGELPKEA